MCKNIPVLTNVISIALMAQTTYTPGRYDMGVRLQLVDQAWVKASNEEKSAAVPFLSAAVSGFFGGKPVEVCESLDKARAKLTKRQTEYYWGKTFRPSKPIFEGEEPITFRGDWCYSPPVAPDSPLLIPSNGKPKPNKYGVARIKSRMPNGQEMMAAWVRDWQATKSKLESLRNPTAKGLAESTRRMVENPRSWSHALDLASWIEVAFRLEVGEMKSLREIPRVEHLGTEFRIAFPKKTGPETGVMIALHGAGGEADMFFESYGAGVWRKRAEAAGMIFASPTTSARAPAAVLDWLETVREVEPKRVILVGHSMGGGAALSAAATLARKPDALVLLAPAAGAFPPAVKGIPTLVCVGESEIMMIRNMSDRLKTAAEATPNGKYLTIPRAEHLMVAAESVGPAFDWLERLGK